MSITRSGKSSIIFTSCLTFVCIPAHMLTSLSMYRRSFRTIEIMMVIEQGKRNQKSQLAIARFTPRCPEHPSSRHDTLTFLG